MIRAEWHRTIRVRPYESETLELAVESDSPKGVASLVEVEQLSRALSDLGDRLVADRLKLHSLEESVATAPCPVSPDRGPHLVPAKASEGRDKLQPTQEEDPYR
jgi:hypothetical protein